MQEFLNKLTALQHAIDGHTGLLRGCIDDEEARLDEHVNDDVCEAFGSLERALDAMCAASAYVSDAMTRLAGSEVEDAQA